jgi:hypothetical protein
VFIHGSGFVLWSLDTHDGMCRNLCARSGCVVASVDYRLAPEHKFPARIEDCLRWAAAHAAELGADARRVAVAGDSAGGNVAAVTALRLRNEGGPALCGQLLLHPVTDYHTPAAEGHEDQFPPPRLSAGCGFRKETFAGAHGNGRDAPIPAIRGTEIERQGSTQTRPSRPRQWVIGSARKRPFASGSPLCGNRRLSQFVEQRLRRFEVGGVEAFGEPAEDRGEQGDRFLRPAIDELTGIGGGLGAARARTFGMNSDFEDETAKFAWITRLAKETGRQVWFLLTDRPTDPERWRRIMAGVHQARAAGASVTAQVAGRPVGVILGILAA